MTMLFKLAWRNIWRNPRRTLILVCAMMAGLVGVLFSMGLTNSWLVQMKDNAVRTYAGHVKIHADGYVDRPSVDTSFEDTDALRAFLSGDDRVAAWAERVAVQGLLSTAYESRVIQLVGVDPGPESKVSVIPDAVIDGISLAAWDQPGRPLLMGRRLAERLEREVGNKVVLLSQQLGNNEVGSGAFRIAGIFDSGNGGFDESHVYLLKQDLQDMLGLGERITEIVLILDAIENSEAVAAAVREELSGQPLEVLSWRDQLPLVVKSIELTRQMMIPYYAIFYIAMAFGILNTLLMAIGERTHELGILLAIGLTRFRLVALILLESACISLVAVAAGTAAGWGLVAWFGQRGIDLSAMAEGLAYLGVSRVIHPSLRAVDIVGAVAVTFLVAAVFALYPAWRASRLAPVEAIQHP